MADPKIEQVWNDDKKSHKKKPLSDRVQDLEENHANLWTSHKGLWCVVLLIAAIVTAYIWANRG